MHIALVIAVIISAILAVMMLFAKNPITSAICLLGILLMSAGMYALMGEHLVATIQLVVYAGAIMVLFVFSIMLLNLSNAESEFKNNPKMFYAGMTLGATIFSLLAYAVCTHFSKHTSSLTSGVFTNAKVEELGGNAKVLAHSLFSQFYISFEVISLALLVAVVGAVVLAKRKFD
ncbi:MAG: NADH-quinone oxidoreductase subunit J [Bacteriovoracaceae bacterium]|nr:NADH-quinone oxidoreductase subunit J [Bacteriovoracaceae bacterium]